MVKEKQGPWASCMYKSQQKVSLEAADFRHACRIPFVQGGLSLVFGISACVLNATTNMPVLDVLSYAFTSISIAYAYCANSSVNELKALKLKRSHAKNTPLKNLTLSQ